MRIRDKSYYHEFLNKKEKIRKNRKSVRFAYLFKCYRR